MAKKDSNGNPLGKGRGLRRSSKGTADWEGVNGNAVVRAIAAASRAGGALRFGYSRDGGAYSIGIYGDGDPYTEYIPPHESVEDVLSQIEELFQDVTPKK
jgi:hypothetical protein